MRLKSSPLVDRGIIYTYTSTLMHPGQNLLDHALALILGHKDTVNHWQEQVTCLVFKS